MKIIDLNGKLQLPLRGRGDIAIRLFQGMVRFFYRNLTKFNFK